MTPRERIIELETQLAALKDLYPEEAEPTPAPKPLPVFSAEEHKAVFDLVPRMLKLQPLEGCEVIVWGSGVMLPKGFQSCRAHSPKESLALYGFVCAWLQVREIYIAAPADSHPNWEVWNGRCNISTAGPTLSVALSAYLDEAEREGQQ